MTPRKLSNPPNPWASTALEYLDEVPRAEIEVYEDHTKEIIARNDSPDVGFEFSVNPYRGCMHACSYCLAGETPILLASGRTKPLAMLKVGDAIVGTVRDGVYRRYCRTTVLDHWTTLKPAHRVLLSDGGHLVASADHRFLTRRGWKHAVGAEQGRARRPHLTPNDVLLGTPAFVATPPETDEYRVGYLCGMVRGDALLRTYSYDGRRRGKDRQHQFRLALVDMEGLQRSRAYLEAFDIATQSFAFQEAAGARKAMHATRTHASVSVNRIQELVAWPSSPTKEWERGFLAGIFDAEGSYSGAILRIANQAPEIIEATSKALRTLQFDFAVERQANLRAKPIFYVSIRGGLGEHLRFFHTVDPAISRKRSLEGQALKSHRPRRVVSVEPLGVVLPLYDITTGTGDFIANGIVSHNCYARPSHEYLSMGAGTDFETKIAVKPKAPQLLRAAFERPSWKGSVLVFSGVTDCYQPLEASYKLTRGCLEVCAEYHQPVGIITKAALIERDLDVLTELNAKARVHVSISVPFWDPAIARAIEPTVATPQRRIKVIERLAKAGIPVGVMVAPIIPGLGDEAIAHVLAAAREAGATSAGYVLLRLPGSVKAVFEERLRATLPLRAERVLHRIRETRGGELYDSRWGVRQTGKGLYALAIQSLFETTARKLGFRTDLDERPRSTTFRRPEVPTPQLSLL